jgi:dTDP-4-dehydrorhamnose 3,5-epimerase-like enzyme
LDKPEVSAKFGTKVTRQTYEERKSVADVKLIDFNFYADDGGDFHEIARISGNTTNLLDGFQIRQINRSRFNPGLVKAFHLHLRQDEVWAVHPLDRLLVGLIDVRKGSATEGESMRLVLGGGKAKFLYIPRGVAHGGMALEGKPVDVVYIMNEHFSGQDELRLPWNTLGDDFWEIRKG